MLVAALTRVAGGDLGQAVALASSMLCLQFAVGAANDWFDVDLDALSKPAKPIPAGLVGRRTALGAALLLGVSALLIAALAPGRGGVVTPLAAAWMLGAGLVYDASLKRTAWGWLAFALAFPVLPVFAWYGAVGSLPPRAELLLPVAFLAGPVLQLANGMVDLERDAASGVAGLAGRLGRRRALLTMGALELMIYALAGLTLAASPTAPGLGRLLAVAAGELALAGVALSTAHQARWREWGWRCQAVGIALLAAGWLASVDAWAAGAG